MSRYKTIGLNELKCGKSAVIQNIFGDSELRFALLKLGIEENTRIENVFSSPFGDPKAYLCRGTLISVRNRDAEKIIVLTEVPDEA